MTLPHIVQTAHAVISAYLGGPYVDWDDECNASQCSIINQEVQYFVDHPDASASDSHTSLVDRLTASGWEYGPITNVATKQTNLLVPFSELPEIIRTNLTLIHAATRALLRQPLYSLPTDDPLNAHLQDVAASIISTYLQMHGYEYSLDDGDDDSGYTRLFDKQYGQFLDALPNMVNLPLEIRSTALNIANYIYHHSGLMTQT